MTSVELIRRAAAWTLIWAFMLALALPLAGADGRATTGAAQRLAGQGAVSHGPLRAAEGKSRLQAIAHPAALPAPGSWLPFLAPAGRTESDAFAWRKCMAATSVRSRAPPDCFDPA